MSPTAVLGGPRLVLRLEGAVLLAAGAWGFAATGESWWLFFALLLIPDVFMAGYAHSSFVGAITYNLAHSYPAPALVGAAALVAESTVGQGIAAVWFAHIGMDRALGYGLKYATGFHDTHLGRIGRG